jgi:hypothetical protein
MADSEGTGTLKHLGFVKAMRLISMAQLNRPLDLTKAEKGKSSDFDCKLTFKPALFPDLWMRQTQRHPI